MRAVVVVGALAACGGKSGPTVDELHKQHAPTIEPKLANIEKIAKAPLPDPTGTVKLSGPMIAWIHSTGELTARGNASFNYDVDLKDLRIEGNATLRTSDT